MRPDCLEVTYVDGPIDFLGLIAVLPGPFQLFASDACWRIFTSSTPQGYLPFTPIRRRFCILNVTIHHLFVTCAPIEPPLLLLWCYGVTICCGSSPSPSRLLLYDTIHGSLYDTLVQWSIHLGGEQYRFGKSWTHWCRSDLMGRPTFRVLVKSVAFFTLTSTVIVARNFSLVPFWNILFVWNTFCRCTIPCCDSSLSSHCA